MPTLDGFSDADMTDAITASENEANVREAARLQELRDCKVWSEHAMGVVAAPLLARGLLFAARATDGGLWLCLNNGEVRRLCRHYLNKEKWVLYKPCPVMVWRSLVNGTPAEAARELADDCRKAGTRRSLLVTLFPWAHR